MPIKYKLIYFNARGRAETIRLILAAAEVEYEDYRVDQKEWPNLKPEVPLKFLPCLEIDESKLCQSASIARFLAKQYGLAGRNLLECTIIDSVAENINEIRENFIPLIFIKDEEEKKAGIERFVEDKAKPILVKLEENLVKNKGGDGYFVGDKISWADLHLCDVIDKLERSFPDPLTDYPKLSALVQRVTELPKIADYLKNRPQTAI